MSKRGIQIGKGRRVFLELTTQSARPVPAVQCEILIPRHYP